MQAHTERVSALSIAQRTPHRIVTAYCVVHILRFVRLAKKHSGRLTLSDMPVPQVLSCRCYYGIDAKKKSYHYWLPEKSRTGGVETAVCSEGYVGDVFKVSSYHPVFESI